MEVISSSGLGGSFVFYVSGTHPGPCPPSWKGHAAACLGEAQKVLPRLPVDPLTTSDHPTEFLRLDWTTNPGPPHNSGSTSEYFQDTL